MPRVNVVNRQGVISLRAPRLRRLVRLAAANSWKGAEVSLAVVGGREMAALNRRYTGRHGDTDVLAFPLADALRGGDKVVGEIVVCASRAVAEARARGVAPQDELALYVAHGALHLLGFDDHTREDRRAMYAREEEVLRQAGIPYVRQRPRKRPEAGRTHASERR
jgi:probable rRNA maturation factor